MMNNSLFGSLLPINKDKSPEWNKTYASWAIQELLAKSKERDILKYQDMDFDVEFPKSDDKVTSLLWQYKMYADIFESMNHVSSISEDTWAKIRELLKSELQTIWDAMKYDNPYIWLKYKLLAYKDEGEKKIETLWDLLSHCSPEWYICWKRLHFLHAGLLKYYSLDIYNLEKDMRIEDFLHTPYIEDISRQRDFMLEWLYYEYYQVWNKVMKWANYNQTKTMGNWRSYKK